MYLVPIDGIHAAAGRRVWRQNHDRVALCASLGVAIMETIGGRVDTRRSALINAVKWSRRQSPGVGAEKELREAGSGNRASERGRSGAQPTCTSYLLPKGEHMPSPAFSCSRLLFGYSAPRSGRGSRSCSICRSPQVQRYVCYRLTWVST